MSPNGGGRRPFTTVAVSAASYALLLNGLNKQSARSTGLRESIKLISALHSAWMTVATLCTLKLASWGIPDDAKSIGSSRDQELYPDESSNPIISGVSDFGNMLTAIEAGYMTYDTGALLLEIYLRTGRPSLLSTISRFAKESPAFLVHHIGIASALLYLQSYIARGREKGVWVILSFFLMNASTPFMHARWLLRKRNGMVSPLLDTFFAAAFAVSRFGVVAWVLHEYATHHRLSIPAALNKLRPPCRAGTGLLVGLNAVWWLLFVKGIYRRSMPRSVPS